MYDKLKLAVGDVYRDGINRRVEIMCGIDDVIGMRYIGVIKFEPPGSGFSNDVRMYDEGGRMLDCGQREAKIHLIRKMTPGQDTWDRLSPREKDEVTRIVKAFRDLKITGVRILRGIYGWGLVEAKNVFEGVTIGDMTK